MNNKKKTIILIVLFVVLMIGASALYNNLSADYKMDSLVIENSNPKDNAENNLSNTTSNDSDNNMSDTTSNNPDQDSSDTNKKETSSNAPENETASKDENTSKDETASKDENASKNETASENENQLSKAPDFTVYDLTGNEVNLSDFFGKPMIVNFWASWCGPCQMEMPDFDAAYTDYKDEIEFLMVNMTDGSRETIEKASSFIEDKGYSFPVYYDTEYSAAITYSVSSLPTTYFIDAKGNLIAHARGAIDADTLQKGIDMIYSKEQ